MSDGQISGWSKAAAILLLIAGGAACSISQDTDLQLAEELSRQNKIDEAIAAYHRHMEARLAIQNRREWENPYFYLILIGDLELGRGNVDLALLSYQEAKDRGVYEGLISDRFRSVATWYEDRGQLDQAFAHLKKYRELDTLLFDAQLDRLAREIVRQEESGERLTVPSMLQDQTPTARRPESHDAAGEDPGSISGVTRPEPAQPEVLRAEPLQIEPAGTELPRIELPRPEFVMPVTPSDPT